MVEEPNSVVNTARDESSDFWGVCYVLECAQVTCGGYGEGRGDHMTRSY